MMVDTSVAQQTDVNTFCATENEYWNIIRKKTPPLFSCALFTGVLAGGADSGTADQVGALGRLYGQMIQISDDISDLFKEFVTADWKKKGNNLALIHCLQANYERKHEFNSLLENINDPAALPVAQQIVIESGGLSYCIYHLLALNMHLVVEFNKLNLPKKDKLTEISDAILFPVFELIKKTGIMTKEEFTQLDLKISNDFRELNRFRFVT